MAMPAPAKITAEQYLTAERAAPLRSEYWQGEVFAMAGATDTHEVICSNLLYFAQHRLRGRGCQVYGSNMKVGLAKKSGFAYPDASIVCGERKFLDAARDVLVNPPVIFEVLFPSTRDFDLGSKFLEYQKLDSLRHYVVIQQDVRAVYHYTWQSGGAWLVKTLSGDDSVELSAIGIDLPLVEIYDHLSMPDSPAE